MSPSQRDKSSSSIKRKTQSSQPTLISNYFKKIESPTEKRRPPPTPAKDVPEENSSVLDEDSIEGPRSPKRQRLETPPLDLDESIRMTSPSHTEQNALTALMVPKVKDFRPPPESPRTARYRYIRSSPTTTNGTETLPPEDLQKRKSLHEKFVQKLGRPDSLAVIRKPAEHGESSISDEEGREEEEEEEEPSPAVKNLRGKYAAKTQPRRATKNTSETAANAKLTPLERQFVEIKKKYPDTLLLIEVGYKFRFFGEDAKVCLFCEVTDCRLLLKNWELLTL